MYLNKVIKYRNKSIQIKKASQCRIKFRHYHKGDLNGMWYKVIFQKSMVSYNVADFPYYYSGRFYIIMGVQPGTWRGRRGRLRWPPAMNLSSRATTAAAFHIGDAATIYTTASISLTNRTVTTRVSEIFLYCHICV